jgi:hypothetical protein
MPFMIRLLLCEPFNVDSLKMAGSNSQDMQEKHMIRD